MIVAFSLLLGQVRFLEIRATTERTPILTFHDVIERRDRHSVWFDTTVQEFRDILSWLDRRKAVYVSLDRLYANLTTGAPLPKNAVVITFADNYEGFYRHAYPILKKRKIPTAMFVHTGYVGSRQGRPKMTWEQLRILDREGWMTVGSQTVNHPADLGKLSATQQRKELVDSKHMLEKQLGHPVPYLAYPNGKFNRESLRVAQEAGYRMAFAENQTPAQVSPTILAVNRYVHTQYRKAWKESGR